MTFHNKHVPPLIHGIGGCSAGVLATTLLHPLDVVKTRFQSRGSAAYGGLRGAFSHILRRSGVFGLYVGLSPNVIGNAAAWGAYFYFYTHFKTLRSNQVRRELHAYEHMLLASCAGAITQVVTNPIWLLKTRLILDCEIGAGTSAPRYRGLIHAVRTILRTEGILGFYNGLTAGLFGVSHGAMQFVAYEHLKKLAIRSRGVEQLGSFHFLVIGAMSKVFAVLCTYPYQVVRTRMQERPEVGRVRFSGLVQCASAIRKQHGWRGFYNGMTASILRVTPHAAVTFMAYETIVSLLDNSLT